MRYLFDHSSPSMKPKSGFTNFESPNPLERESSKGIIDQKDHQRQLRKEIESSDLIQFKNMLYCGKSN